MKKTILLSLIIFSISQTIFAQIAADALAYALPNARRVVLSGGGHLINLSEPERYSQAVLEFLGSAA